MSKFSLIALFALVSIAAGYQHADGGHSNVHRQQDVNGNYNFGYDIADPWGASNYRQESGDGWGNVKGSYGLKDKDGRMRKVEYVADKNGFRVALKSNEPSVGNLDSADAIYNGPDQWGSATYVPSGHKGKDSWDGNHHGHHKNSWDGNHHGHHSHHGHNKNSWDGNHHKNSWDGNHHKNSWEGNHHKNSWDGNHHNKNAWSDKYNKNNNNGGWKNEYNQDGLDFGLDLNLGNELRI